MICSGVSECVTTPVGAKLASSRTSSTTNLQFHRIVIQRSRRQHFQPQLFVLSQEHADGLGPRSQARSPTAIFSLYVSLIQRYYKRCAEIDMWFAKVPSWGKLRLRDLLPMPQFD